MLPMGHTNPWQVFDRVMRKVLRHQILRGRCKSIIDYVAAKLPSRSTYPDSYCKLKMSKILVVHLYILEAIQSLNKVLVDLERVGGIILVLKSTFLCKGLKIVMFFCNGEGRHSVAMKL